MVFCTNNAVFDIEDVLVFAKPQPLVTKRIVIETLIEEVVELLRPQATMQNTELIVDFNGVTFVDCEPNQLKQVFVNIMKNAMEAMPAGGVLSIRLHSTNTTVRLDFSDQGQGIPKALISKLGDPFFTTKDGGTGLGLMVSQKIVTAHKGHMLISSEVGVGTIVSVELPMATP